MGETAFARDDDPASLHLRVVTAAQAIAGERRDAAEAPITAGWPSPRTAWYAIGVLALVRLSAQLDLGILSLLVEPIKRDLHLSDSQMGLLLGFAFASFYLILGVPLAALVDRTSRRAILAVGITVWSVMTALCGFAQSFAQLFACRVGVGAGEAVNGPATYSMIADLFPRERLARAIAVINLGSMAGVGLSLVLGAVVIDALASYAPPVLPIVGQVRHWQLVLLMVGCPGLIIALLMMTVREPVRRVPPGTAHVVVKGANLRTCLTYIAANRAIFGPLFLGMAVAGIESGGTSMWRPAFYQRTYGWTPQQVGYAIGIVQLIAAPIGLFIGAWLAERLARRRDDANLRVVAYAWALATPLMIVGPLMPTPELAVMCGGITIIFTMMAAPTQHAALQSITPNHMRGQITALYLLAHTLAQQGIGPSFIAAVTQFGIQDEAGLRYALAGSALLMMPIALTLMLLGARPYGREITRLKALEAAAR